jgi:hypothetical protein
MKHPTADEWMSFLYGESSATERSRLSAHLTHCPECRAQAEGWRGAMQALDEWRLPVPGRARALWLGPVKWAAAAALILGLGVALGRFTSPALAEARQWKAGLERDMQQQFQLARAQLREEFKRQQEEGGAETQRLLAEMVKAAEEQRATDRESTAVALRQLDDSRIRDQAQLRKELETVAVLTQSGFEQTQEEFVQLANFTQPHANK